MRFVGGLRTRADGGLAALSCGIPAPSWRWPCGAASRVDTSGNTGHRFRPGDATMPNTLASSARFIAFADPAPTLLTDVEDLHDHDLDGLLRDRLPQERRRSLRPAP